MRALSLASGFAFACLSLVLLAHPAKADLRLCNRTSYVMDAATATVRGKDSVAQGWTHLAPGDCQSAITGPLIPASYLVYARSSLAHAGPPRAWGGNMPVCVKDGPFELHQATAQTGCTAPDTFALPFALVNPKGKSDWTMDFDESPALPSLTAAQLAGVKRLLDDNGYKTGAINGNPDRPTELALADFRKKMKFKPGDGNDVLFAVLEKQAQTKSAPQGYTVCNEDGEPLLTAIAQTDAGKPVSRGWWRIAPKACAHILTTPLKGNVYLLAQKVGGGTVVGGSEKFCVLPGAFEAPERGNCGAHAMGESGFAVTAGRGPGFVAHIGPNGLVR
jgi:uncharacterized membrane protein